MADFALLVQYLQRGFVSMQHLFLAQLLVQNIIDGLQPVFRLPSAASWTWSAGTASAPDGQTPAPDGTKGEYITYFCTARCAMAEGDAKLPGMTVGSIGVGATFASPGLFLAILAGVGGVEAPPRTQKRAGSIWRLRWISTPISTSSLPQILQTLSFSGRGCSTTSTGVPFGDHVNNTAGGGACGASSFRPF